MCRLGSLLLCSISPVYAQFAGNSLEFDGVNDFANVPHHEAVSFEAGDSATVELWLNPTSAPDIWHAMGKRDGCGSGAGINYQLARDPASLVSFGGTGCGFGTNMDIPLNQWTHVAVTIGESELRMYLNGELVGQKSNCDFGGANVSPLRFGNSDECADSFPGMIDEVRIWNTVRTHFDIAATWRCTMLATPPDLVGHWKFDEALASQTIIDSSASGLDGSLGGNTDPDTDDPSRVVSLAPITCQILIRDGYEDRQ